MAGGSATSTVHQRGLSLSWAAETTDACLFRGLAAQGASRVFSAVSRRGRGSSTPVDGPGGSSFQVPVFPRPRRWPAPCFRAAQSRAARYSATAPSRTSGRASWCGWAHRAEPSASTRTSESPAVASTSQARSQIRRSTSGLSGDCACKCGSRVRSGRHLQFSAPRSCVGLTSGRRARACWLRWPLPRTPHQQQPHRLLEHEPHEPAGSIPAAFC